jgi:predicted RNase H-like nuclease (RuvC/YqgF family)
MEKLSLRKQLVIVRLYLSGFSYDEIAAQAGVSKGTVANVITELKAGRILNVHEPAEQLWLLRELAVDLRRLRLNPGQAVAGLALFSHLQELAIEPADVERWAAMCRELVPQGTEAQVFVRAALALKELRERTGLSAQALEEKVHSLEEGMARLEPIVQNLKGCQQELKQLEKRRQSLSDEVSRIEKRLEPLRKDVTHKERRETELSQRVQELEQRAQAADERLAAARRDLQALAGLGLSPDDLTGFAQRVSGVAQRHGVEPGALRSRLLQELEELEAGLGLESRVNIKRDELNDIEQAIAKAQQQRLALDSALQQLRQQQAELHASITEEQAHIRKEMQAIARIARDAASKLGQDLRNSTGNALQEIQGLRDQAFEAGKELGRFEATIEANQWLQVLLALVRGDGGVSAVDVRVVGLTVLRGCKAWFQQNQGQTSLTFGVMPVMDSTIKELEQWKV